MTCQKCCKSRWHCCKNNFSVKKKKLLVKVFFLFFGGGWWVSCYWGWEQKNKSLVVVFWRLRGQLQLGLGAGAGSNRGKGGGCSEKLTGSTAVQVGGGGGRWGEGGGEGGLSQDRLKPVQLLYVYWHHAALQPKGNVSGLKSGAGCYLVDHPTQLFCFWRFICCVNTQIYKTQQVPQSHGQRFINFQMRSFLAALGFVIYGYPD